MKKQHSILPCLFLLFLWIAWGCNAQAQALDAFLSNSVGEGVDSETVAVFNVSLKQGPTMLRDTFLDDQGKEICGAYSVSVPCLTNVP